MLTMEMGVCESLELITGPMFSGKSRDLIGRLTDAEVAGSFVRAIKPTIAADPTIVTSLVGSSFPARPASSGPEVVASAGRADVVGIDEVQFFDASIVEAVAALCHRGARVIAAGLDLDFRARPFGSVAELSMMAGSVARLTAICQRCRRTATRSQRLLHGRPAGADSPTVLVSKRLYEPRCEQCFLPALEAESLPR